MNEKNFIESFEIKPYLDNRYLKDQNEIPLDKGSLGPDDSLIETPPTLEDQINIQRKEVLSQIIVTAMITILWLGIFIPALIQKVYEDRLVLFLISSGVFIVDMVLFTGFIKAKGKLKSLIKQQQTENALNK